MTDSTDTMGHNSNAMDVKSMLREEPKAIYHDTKLLAALEATLDAEIAAAPKDMSVRANREVVKSAAYAVATLKSKLDAAGKDLTEEFRKRTNEVNVVRKEITTTLEAKQHALRAPLTDWEEAEKVREEKVRAFRAYLEDSLRVPSNVTIEQLAKRRQKIEDTAIEPDVFDELVDKVREERDAALKALDEAKERIERAKRDAEELEALRLEKAQRDAADKAERDRQAAEEEKRIEREAAERERQEAIRKAEQEAADKVRREEQERQAAELARVEEERRAAAAKAQAEIDGANRRAREAEEARQRAEAAAQAEREERERVEAARRAEEEAAAERERKRQAAEDAEIERRLRDRAHRNAIMTATKEDLMEHAKITDEQARRVVLAIVGGNVRNAKVEF